MVDDMCGYVGRMLSLLTVTTAIVLSIVASSNCHFLQFTNESDEPWTGLEPPFDGVFEAHVGIFSYEIMRATDESLVTDGCTAYDGQFGNMEYEALIAAQFCALFAPLLGIMGLIISCFDTFLCRFFCSFLIASGLFLAACGVQGGTFSLFAEPDFCIQGPQNCSVGVSVYLSGASSILFFCACLFLCCFPTPDPLFGKKEPTRQKSSGGQQNVVIQPVIVDRAGTGNERAWDYDENNDDDNDGEHDHDFSEEDPEAPSRMNSRVSQNGDKITKEDFDFESPQTGSDRVEIKERKFPDGRTQVDEVTYHPDGTKSVKTRTYRD